MTVEVVEVIEEVQVVGDIVEVLERQSPEVVEHGQPGPAGPPGASSSTVREAPAGAVDGSNVDFTTSQAFGLGTTQVFLNGLLQEEPGDYNELSTTSIRFVDAPLPGDRLMIVYEAGG